MVEVKLVVPTYNGRFFTAHVEFGQLPEYGEPRVPVQVCLADGVRIVLGSPLDSVNKMPEIQIKRHPKGWAIALRPLGDSELSGYVHFFDDGRRAIVQETGCGPEDAIEFLDWDERVPEFDGPP